VALGLAVLLVWGAVSISEQSARHLAPETITTRILLFVLWYIDLTLIVAVLFVIFRALIKLMLERRRGVLGSKFKTKLLVTYIGLTLIPIGLIFIAATDLLQKSIDRWFALPVQQVMDRARQVNDMADRRLGDAARNEAHALARTLPAEPRAIEAFLRQDAHLRSLGSVEWYPGGRAGFRAISSAPAGEGPPLLSTDDLRDVTDPQGWPRIDVTSRGGHWIRAGVRNARGTVVVGFYVRPAEAKAGEFLSNAWSDYQKFEVQRPAIKASNLLTFLLLTLAVLFAAIWIGLTLARRITIPIQAMAESTRRIAEGDLTARVEAPAIDELGVLVDSFNTMTTELRENKEALLRSNRGLTDTNSLLSAVLSSVHTGIAVFDPDGRVAMANPAIERILGLRARPRHLDEWRAIPSLHPLVEYLEKNRDSAADTTREFTLERDERPIRVEAAVAPLRAPESSIPALLLALEDTTEIARAQKLQAWSEVARRVAHEIKNPLTPIRLSAERMIRKLRSGDPETPQAVEEGARLIVEEVELLKSLVDEFSMFARMPETRPTPTDVRALTERVLRLYEDPDNGVCLRLDDHLAQRQFLLDPDQIQRALSNLLENALEATPKGGEITVRLSEADGHLSIEVADCGRGVPRTDRDKLFLPDFSTKGRGTGLGLAIVQRIVADHHGTIRCEDNKPRGARFIIELPAA
jgi:two-component system, NtrC family, nitrogen regulation sensor histidine kinase NtrY